MECPFTPFFGGGGGELGSKSSAHEAREPPYRGLGAATAAAREVEVQGAGLRSAGSKKTRNSKMETLVKWKNMGQNLRNQLQNGWPKPGKTCVSPPVEKLSGETWTKTCGLPLLFKFEAHPAHSLRAFFGFVVTCLDGFQPSGSLAFSIFLLVGLVGGFPKKSH